VTQNWGNKSTTSLELLHPSQELKGNSVCWRQEDFPFVSDCGNLRNQLLLSRDYALVLCNIKESVLVVKNLMQSVCPAVSETTSSVWKADPPSDSCAPDVRDTVKCTLRRTSEGFFACLCISHGPRDLALQTVTLELLGGGWPKEGFESNL